jgi:hypothetical protein
VVVLLFVFWYCHKRGKEVRLEKERQLSEQEMQQLDDEYRKQHPEEVLTTTAEKGAPMEQVREGISEVEAVKAAAEQSSMVLQEQPVDPKIVPPSTVPE